MCGVIGLISERARGDLGRVAGELLRTLEYRGYDSTGAAFQGDDGEVRLLKGVGAPSVMIGRLGIQAQTGRIFCGQVRWATYGAVTDANSQPHVVRCRTHIYGAHNGNVSNCDDLKAWLVSERHDVRSDNDGEMVVHTIEHHFEQALASLPPARREDFSARREAMRQAIAAAVARFEGSFAAVIVDPVARVLYALKLGSSLYFGLGVDPDSGRFAIASSDLSAVLKLTRVLIPISEGEVVEFDAEAHQVYRLERPAGASAPQAPVPAALVPVGRSPIRSRLRAEDTALSPPFETFMEQEIAAQEGTVRSVVRLLCGGSDAARAIAPALLAMPAAERDELRARLELLCEGVDAEVLRAQLHALVDAPAFEALLGGLGAETIAELDGPVEAGRLVSSEAAFLADLAGFVRGPRDRLALRLLDAVLERDEADDLARAVDRFAELAHVTVEAGGRLYVTCCGSSFHAAKAAALFFAELAHVELIPVLPGEFRGQCLHALRDGDLLVAVSQSGETKDLIDVVNAVLASGREIARVAIVNNVNSTLAQEKADLVIPLRCGPEVAVPATKSFLNQVTIFYGLALRLAGRRAGDPALPAEERAALARDLGARWDRLPTLPALIRATLDGTREDVERAAQMLYLKPSLHILATRISAVAREGALKVREVVLNHTEGFEGSEFKHGPNTILGYNTIFGPEQLAALLGQLGVALEALVGLAADRRLGAASVRRLVQAATDSVFSATPSFALGPEEREVLELAVHRDELLAALLTDYPLVYVTGPDERDVALTVSQINTHKIRGASTVVIAEDGAPLRAAATKAPAGQPGYRHVFIALPRTNDTSMTVFSATVVLQRLALRMSLLKARYLDRLGVRDHGVHPDVPKNVSKSITVD